MKLKKIIGSIASFMMCFVLMTGNVTALEIDSGLTLVEQTQDINLSEIIDIMQLTENSRSSQPKRQEFDLASFGDVINPYEEVDNAEEVGEISLIPTDANESERNDDSYISISPAATAIPLSSLGITGMWLGNTGSDPFSGYNLKDNPNWNEVFFVDGGSYYPSVNVNIDATGFTYIRIRVLQWGQSTSKYTKLDSTSPTSSIVVRDLNQFGQIISVGETVYATYTDYIFKIPTGVATSNAKFISYSVQVPQISLETNANITWKTPTGSAPTTPAISFNYDDDYGLVTGLNNTMEYRAKYTDENNNNTYTSWMPISGSALLVPINNRQYTLQVRYKTSTNGNPSLNCELIVKTRSNAPLEYVDYLMVDELLGIYPSNKQIEVRLGDFSSYIPVTGGYYYTLASFVDSIPSGGLDRVYVRYAATANEPASNYIYYTIYGRNPNTPDAVYYQNGSLYNLTPNMVFRFNGGTWYNTSFSSANITSFMSTTNTTLLEIKYLPTETSSCSATRQIILPKL